MNIKSTSVIIGVTFLVLLGVFFQSFRSVSSMPYDANSDSFNRSYWAERFVKNDISRVYHEFVEKNTQAPAQLQHLSAHVIGELLFEQAGVSGIRYCDASFGFGCYHGFFGSAVSQEGPSIIKKLDRECVATYGVLGTGCQHGIGHGIMEYVGGGRIVDALALCKETTQVTKLLGCTSGVFMEYNTPLGSDDEFAPAQRLFDSTDAYSPCTEVDNEYKDSCYFELGQWFAIIFPNDYAHLMTLCSDVQEVEHRLKCFMGVGALTTPLSGYDVNKVLSVCESMEEIGEFACRAGASWAFFADPVQRVHASELCHFKEPGVADSCRILADLTEGLESR